MATLPKFRKDYPNLADKIDKLRNGFIHHKKEDINSQEKYKEILDDVLSVKWLSEEDDKILRQCQLWKRRVPPKKEEGKTQEYESPFGQLVVISYGR